MNLLRRIAPCLAHALLLCATAAPAFAAADYFWNCTTPDGIQYADASKCDKGDTAVKVMKGNQPAGSAQTARVQVAAGEEGEKPIGSDTGVCPANPAYCTQPNYGVTQGSPRTQAIEQFMREKACAFAKRFPQRCMRSN